MGPRKKRGLQAKEDIDGLPADEVVRSLSVSSQGRLEQQDDLSLLGPPALEDPAEPEALERKLRRRTYTVNLQRIRRETYFVSVNPVMKSRNETDSETEKKPKGRKKMTISIIQEDQDLKTASNPKKRGRPKQTDVAEPMPAIQIPSPATESIQVTSEEEPHSADMAIEMEEKKEHEIPEADDAKPEMHEANEVVQPKKVGRLKKTGAVAGQHALNTVDGATATKGKRGRPKKEQVAPEEPQDISELQDIADKPTRRGRK